MQNRALVHFVPKTSDYNKPFSAAFSVLYTSSISIDTAHLFKRLQNWRLMIPTKICELVYLIHRYGDDDTLRNAAEDQELYLSELLGSHIQLEVAIIGVRDRFHRETHPASQGLDAFCKALLGLLGGFPQSKLPENKFTWHASGELFQPSGYRPSDTATYSEFAQLARNAARHLRTLPIPQGSPEEPRALVAALEEWANALAPQPRSPSRPRRRPRDSHNASENRNAP